MQKLLRKVKRKIFRAHENKVVSNIDFESKQNYMEEVIKYLCYEVSDLRSKLRFLLAEKIHELPHAAQTYESFDYQWRNLSEGQHLLSDSKFRKEVQSTICKYSALSPEWFANKKILDAGCGLGRFTYGFASLNSQIVAIDQSQSGIEYARDACKEFTGKVEFHQRDLLEPLNFQSDFDLVWSYGVLHHTGNTYKAFKNVSSLVKPGGYLFLMLYGEPRINEQGDFYIQSEYLRLRRLTKNKPYEEKIKILKKEKPPEHLHGWFDAVSPTVNDTYSLEEIEGWLLNAGFTNIRETSNSGNHHIIAQKKL